VLWKVFFIQLLAFVIAFGLYKLIINVVERCLLKGKYKIKTSFSYLLAGFIMLATGVVFGKEILYSLL